MNDVLFGLIVCILGALVLGSQLHRYRRVEGQLLVASFLAHIVAGSGIEWVARIYYGGASDMLGYFRLGTQLSNAMWRDFLGVTPEVIKLILQQASHTGTDINGPGYSTTTVVGLAGLILFVVNDSLYAACILVSFFSFAGKLAIYTVFRETWPQRLHPRLLVATMLVPSVVFWSSGITKEAFALTGLGFLFLGMHRFIGGHRTGIPLMAAGALAVGLIKAYILLPFIVAAALWYYWVRSMPKTGDLTIKPVYLIAGGLAAVFGVIVLGTIVPRFALTTVTQEAARLQDMAPSVEGGSNYSLGADGSRTLQGQLALAPLAWFTALFRPTVFEIRNAMMFLNAIETTTITAMLAWSLWTRRWAWMWRTVLRSPTMLFCFVFTLILAVGVGLSSMNLGTLSRYRMPMMPFYVALVLVWSAPTQQERMAPAGARAAGPARKPVAWSDRSLPGATRRSQR